MGDLARATFPSFREAALNQAFFRAIDLPVIAAP